MHTCGMPECMYTCMYICIYEIPGLLGDILYISLLLHNSNSILTQECGHADHQYLHAYTHSSSLYMHIYVYIYIHTHTYIYKNPHTYVTNIIVNLYACTHNGIYRQTKEASSMIALHTGAILSWGISFVAILLPEREIICFITLPKTSVPSLMTCFSQLTCTPHIYHLNKLINGR
jgi:hypothetical protein